MAVIASLSASRIEVAPGASTTVTLTVRNTGTVVDEMRTEVLGPLREWATVEPEVLPLFPGATGTVEVRFSPPRAADTRSGEVDLPVKVSSKEDPHGSAVEELTLVIGQFTDTFAELSPRTLKGSRRAKTEVALDNRGNGRVAAAVSAFDADQALTFSFDPPEIVTDAGAANFARVDVKPAKTFLRGPDRTVPFKVVVEPRDGAPITLDAMLVQEALLPKWLMRLLLALLMAIIALALLWQFAFKSVVRSAARTAAADSVQSAADNAAKQTATALGAAPAGSKPSGSKGPGGGTTTTVAGGTTGNAGATGADDDGKGGTSTDKRIAVEAASGASKSGTWTPAKEGQRFSLTDLVLQNPQGDTGRLRVKRGDEVLYETALENFRDLDFHYVAPYIFEGKDLVVEVDCKNPDPAVPCRDAVSLVGFLKAG